MKTDNTTTGAIDNRADGGAMVPSTDNSSNKVTVKTGSTTVLPQALFHSLPEPSVSPLMPRPYVSINGEVVSISSLASTGNPRGDIIFKHLNTLNAKLAFPAITCLLTGATITPTRTLPVLLTCFRIFPCWIRTKLFMGQLGRI